MTDKGQSPTEIATGIAREVLSSLIRSIPDYIIKGTGAFLRWYFRLGLVAMFFVACLIGVGVIVVAPVLGLPLNVQNAVQHTVGPVLVVVLLLVILLGVVRPGR